MSINKFINELLDRNKILIFERFISECIEEERVILVFHMKTLPNLIVLLKGKTWIHISDMRGTFIANIPSIKKDTATGPV